MNLTFLPKRVIDKYAGLLSKTIESERVNLDELLVAHPPGSVDVGAVLGGPGPHRAAALFDLVLASGASGRVASHGGAQFFHHGKWCARRGALLQLSVPRSGETEIEFYIHKNGAFKLPRRRKT